MSSGITHDVKAVGRLSSTVFEPNAADVDTRAAANRDKHTAIQLKTFTRWWNLWLSQRGIKVKDLPNEIKPGVVSVALLELLTENTYRHNKSPKSRKGIQKCTKVR